MKSLSIALKDIQLVLKDGGVWINLVLIPIIFVVVFSGGFEGLAGDDDEEVNLIPLPVVNLDSEGELSQTFIKGLEEVGGLKVELVEQTDAQSSLEDNDIDRLLTIPANFTKDVLDNRQTTLQLVNHPNANMSETETVQLVVQGVAQDLTLENQLVASLEQLGAMRGADASSAGAFGNEQILTHAKTQWEQSQDRPLVVVSRLEPGQLGATEEESPFTRPLQITVPGFTILFVFLAAQTTAKSIYDEKKIGSFRRLLAAPMSKASLLSGKMIPNIITVLIQVAVIFSVAIFLLPVMGLDPLDLGDDIFALVLLTALVALCSTSLGIVIAAIARSENQITGLSTAALWGMGLLGGAFLPTFLYPEFLQALVRVVPHSWAINAYHTLFVFGGGLADITTDLAALLGFTVLFLAVGLWKFDFD